MQKKSLIHLYFATEDVKILKSIATTRRTTMSGIIRQAVFERWLEPHAKEQERLAKLEAEQLARQPKVYAYDEKGNPAYAGLSQKGFEIIVADMAGWAVIPYIVRDRYTRQQWTLIEEGIRRYCQEHGKPGPRDTEAIVAELKARARSE